MFSVHRLHTEEFRTKKHSSDLEQCFKVNRLSYIALDIHFYIYR